MALLQGIFRKKIWGGFWNFKKLWGSLATALTSTLHFYAPHRIFHLVSLFLNDCAFKMHKKLKFHAIHNFKAIRINVAATPRRKDFLRKFDFFKNNNHISQEIIAEILAGGTSQQIEGDERIENFNVVELAA